MVAAVGLALCASLPFRGTSAAQPATARPDRWPQASSPDALTDARTEAFVADLLAGMTLEEKVGQVIQADIAAITPEDLREYPLGSILAGIATATESASIGAVAVVAFAALRGRMSLAVLREATLGTAATSTMIFVILLGASTFSLVFRGLGGEALVEEALRATPGGAFGAMLVFMAVMFVLGFFLDTFEIIFIMLPIFGPPLLKLGYDPVWLGVMVGINLQTSFLTPPFGATLFYMRGVAPPEITTSDIWVSSIPWTWLQLAGLAAVWAFPAIATWLPARVFG